MFKNENFNLDPDEDLFEEEEFDDLASEFAKLEEREQEKELHRLERQRLAKLNNLGEGLKNKKKKPRRKTFRTYDNAF
jgi:hypothetical protein